MRPRGILSWLTLSFGIRLSGTALLASIGCSGEPEPASTDAGPPAIDSGPPVSSCSGDLAVVQVAPWPGGGVQIVLSAPEPDAVVAVEGEGGDPWTTAVAPADEGRGMTAVLIVGSATPEVHSGRLAAARDIVRAASPADRVAAWAAGADGPVLLADATVEREHVLDRIASLPAGEGALELDGPRAALAEVEGPWGALHRTLFVVGAAPAEDGAPFRPVATYFLADGSPDGTAADLVARAARDRDELVRVGACPPDGRVGPIALRVGGSRCELALAAWASGSMAHLANAVCDPTAAATDVFPFPREIDLEFTDQERAVFDDRVTTKSREPFGARIRLGDGEAIRAEAHLHGHTSLDCDRKSFSVNLEGNGPRRIVPGAAGDRFFLLSLCGDAGYFRFHFANLLLRDLGLFPIHDGYVRLRIDGVNQGVYLLAEQPEQGLRRDLIAPRAVIRRREDPDGQRPEVKFPDDEAGAAEALDRYDEMVDLALAGEPDSVGETLAGMLDLDAYLRWLALATFLRVGDYVDEAFFYAAEEDGAWYFRTMAWDTKDIYEGCHHQGRWAIEDPCGVLYCAEADLDDVVVRAPAIYERFLSLVSELPDRLAAELLREAMDRVRTELWDALADDETAAAMTELLATDPAAADADVARAIIRAMMDDVLDAAESRRSELGAILASCPEAPR
ncbi:MAG: CotH kinase family protein [Deltaproteobacteria bacterium]|nr:CotH kinase family protein [Deltaproteobacteria bacterium]